MHNWGLGVINLKFKLLSLSLVVDIFHPICHRQNSISVIGTVFWVMLTPVVLGIQCSRGHLCYLRFVLQKSLNGFYRNLPTCWIKTIQRALLSRIADITCSHLCSVFSVEVFWVFCVSRVFCIVCLVLPI